MTSPLLYGHSASLIVDTVLALDHIPTYKVIKYDTTTSLWDSFPLFYKLWVAISTSFIDLAELYIYIYMNDIESQINKTLVFS